MCYLIYFLTVLYKYNNYLIAHIGVIYIYCNYILYGICYKGFINYTAYNKGIRHKAKIFTCKIRGGINAVAIPKGYLLLIGSGYFCTITSKIIYFKGVGFWG